MSYTYEYPRPAVTADCVVVTITVAYLAFVDSPVEVKGQDDAAKAEWFALSNLPELAFDHEEIMEEAKRIIKDKTGQSTNY